eukprot:462817_1
MIMWSNICFLFYVFSLVSCELTANPYTSKKTGDARWSGWLETGVKYQVVQYQLQLILYKDWIDVEDTVEVVQATKSKTSELILIVNENSHEKWRLRFATEHVRNVWWQQMNADLRIRRAEEKPLKNPVADEIARIKLKGKAERSPIEQMILDADEISGSAAA